MGGEAAGRFLALLEALVAEPDPPTTIREPSEATDSHIADSLSGLEVAVLADAARLGDIGSGVGFPGLALALALPAAKVDLIESARRKGVVAERLALAAGLENCRAVTARAEDWARGDGFGAYGAITARAVAPLAVLVEYAAPLLHAGGAFVAWKGERDADEEDAGRLAAALVGLEPREVRHVVPFPEARARHLHVFVKTAPTPERFPRRAGMARKRPLA
ncbi:MAG: RsmG family class I SAM-dependent methyltransferase [Thermoleophilaceae bacterium]